MDKYSSIKKIGCLLIVSAYCSVAYGQLPAPVVEPPPVVPTIPGVPPAVEVPRGVERFALADAIRVGVSRHPQIRAMNASYNAALTKHYGLEESASRGAFLLPDMKYRKTQSEMALLAAQAELRQAEFEVTFGVIRSYYTVVYAKQQAKVAADLVEQLEVYLEQVRKIVNSKNGGIRGITKDTEDKLVIIISEAKGKYFDAVTGVKKSQALLREAMGYGNEIAVDAADELLPAVEADLTKEVILGHALNRRGEIVLSRIGADVSRLEICAQWSRRLSIYMTTYANAGDIHARSVPLTTRDPEYKPGGFNPEMPDRLIGSRETRTNTAKFYADRAQAVADQAKNLIILETDVAFTRWEDANKKVALFKDASKAAKEMISRQREAAGGTLTKEDLLTNEIAATKAFASYNEALFEQIIALANLERVTSGGVSINFPGR
ncbi:MAG: TolC family protein [Zavarzinella sp.]